MEGVEVKEERTRMLQSVASVEEEDQSRSYRRRSEDESGLTRPWWASVSGDGFD